MNAFNPRHHTLILLKEFHNVMEQGFPFNLSPIPEEDISFSTQLTTTIEAMENNQDDYRDMGQHWISRLFRNYPLLAPRLDRYVLWHFAGEALHFLTNTELEKFQALEEAWLAALDNNAEFDFLERLTEAFKR